MQQCYLTESVKTIPSFDELRKLQRTTALDCLAKGTLPPLSEDGTSRTGSAQSLYASHGSQRTYGIVTIFLRIDESAEGRIVLSQHLESAESGHSKLGDCLDFVLSQRMD